MTTSWKDKMGEGLSKVQGGIDQGKQKIQTTQEAMKIKREIQEKLRAKAEVLMELGQQTYKKLREGSLQNEELRSLSVELVEHDTFLFQKNKELVALSEQSKTSMVCQQCQKENELNASFCGGCGSDLKVVEPEVSGSFISCTTCSEEISESAHFCSCCGTATN